MSSLCDFRGIEWRFRVVVFGCIVNEVEISELFLSVCQFGHKNNRETAAPMGEAFNIPYPPVVILLP